MTGVHSLPPLPIKVPAGGGVFRRLRYGSVCSGIEAATVAWHPLGWQPQFFSEIEAAPRAVLSHHYPEVPLHGDFTTIQDGQYGAIDLLVGGTPCQDFSIAGLRAGLDGERGNLTLEFGRLARRLRPGWFVWENVPGVLSSNGGRDFASVLGLFAGRVLGVPAGGWQNAGVVPGIAAAYGLAWRVLDAQYVRVDGFGRAVPQRRRRVFVVGYLGDWRRAAAVLLERASLRGDPAPRREAGAGAAAVAVDGLDAGSLDSRRTAPGRPATQAFGGGQNCNPTDVSTALSAHPGGRYDLDLETFVAQSVVGSFGTTSPGGGWRIGADEAAAVQLVVQTLRARDGAKGVDSDCTDTLVVHSLRGEGFDASEDGTGRGTPIVPIAFNSRQNPDVTWDRSGSLSSSSPQAEAVAMIGHNGGPRLWAVRRLTPLECERLQGFPDRYTAIPWRGGILADSPRYKAIGNSMAVNAMRWIGRRIDMVERIAAGFLPIPLLAAE